ncbi:ABC transporter ATP-binding protein [Nonomuraea soli]|uniref:Putative ABC transport system ATP-binding protein n=1 Tax=Nonomuraea soli TaxID=1032476 RepID=A0A7W0CFB9_9ACTN|nr:ABC transporter ATP-binding protein [Nonomuraea soli]MBA2889925.1 putative ABC transport system ATP-binding protein [Nonomuraea soli]
MLRQAIGGQRGAVILGAFLLALHQATEALIPVLIGVMIDETELSSLLSWLGVLAGVYVVLSFSYRFGGRIAEGSAERAAHDLRLRVVRRVLHAGGGAEDGRLPGALTTIATEDVRRAGAVNLVVAVAAAGLSGLAVGTVVLLNTSLPLGLLVLLGTPALAWLGHLLAKPLERRSSTEQERAAHASGVAADLVAGLRVLKGIGAEQAAVERYRRTSRDSLAATMRAARAQALQNGLVLALTGLFVALVAYIGARLAQEGTISLGQLVSSVGLALFLMGPLHLLAWVNSELAQARASAARVAEVLAAPPAVAPGSTPAPSPVQGSVRLRGVRLGGLDGLDLEVRPGELLGVVAPDPAAASALLHCLGRSADPLGGVVELDGVDLTGVDPAALREAILVAAHDADLFEGTVLENLGAHTPAALAASGADEVIDSLPEGGQSLVGERGNSLSGGQRQRVALARALAADRPVLVLHEPTTAVDAVTEARIAAGLREARPGRTTILVTTSPALLAAADRVVLVDGGRVAADATHAELVHESDTYRTAVLA